MDKSFYTEVCLKCGDSASEGYDTDADDESTEHGVFHGSLTDTAGLIEKFRVFGH